MRLKTSITIGALGLALGLGLTISPLCAAGSLPNLVEMGTSTSLQSIGAKAVLVLPSQDCRNTSIILARVTRHVRDAERSAWFSPEAEEQYDDALQAIIDARCAEGVRDLLAADHLLREHPDSRFFIDSDDVDPR